MKRFPCAHATHPQWPMAAALVLAQLRAQCEQPGHPRQPALGLLYLTDHFAAHAHAILAHLRSEWPQVSDWVGTVGLGIVVNGAEYVDEPALAVMLCDLPPTQYRVFSGVAPLPVQPGPGDFHAHTALLHADGQTPDLAELLVETAARTRSGQVFGGLTASRTRSVQLAWSARAAMAASGPAACDGVFQGGLSGVAFSDAVTVVSRLTQGVRPVGPMHQVTAAQSNVALALDGRPALDVLLQDLDITLAQPQQAVSRLRRTCAGLLASGPQSLAPGGGPDALNAGCARPLSWQGQLGDDVVVRELIGLDPGRQGFAVADTVPLGSHLTLCERDVQTARADLVRICTEIREELEPAETPPGQVRRLKEGLGPEAWPSPRRMVGAVYVSCSGRAGAYFGGPGAEMQIVQRALGDVPLVGFFAGGEIAHHRLHTYSGVLTVFVAT